MKNRKLWSTIWFNLFLYVESKIMIHMFIQAEIKFIVELIFSFSFFFFFGDNNISSFHNFLFLFSYYYLLLSRIHHSNIPRINFFIQKLPMKYQRKYLHIDIIDSINRIAIYINFSHFTSNNIYLIKSSVGTL